MPKWLIDKTSGIPLYLQLKSLITHYISTGEIQDNQKLPTVKVLSRQLQINFETVRKAYKDLEKEGLLSTLRGRGTFASGHARATTRNNKRLFPETEPIDLFKHAVRTMIKEGASVTELQAMVNDTFRDLMTENSKHLLVFTECNQLQIREISEALQKDLHLVVRPVLLNDLRKTVEEIKKQKTRLVAVVTTGFHMNEVRNLLSGISVDVDFLVTNMSPATRRALENFRNRARFGLICRDPIQFNFFKDLVKMELGIEELASCLLSEESKVEAMLDSVDVLLVSPPVYETIKTIAPPDLPIFNVLDRVDPVSLEVLKHRIFQLV